MTPLDENPYPKGTSAHALWAASVVWGNVLELTVAPLVKAFWRWGTQRPK